MKKPSFLRGLVAALGAGLAAAPAAAPWRNALIQRLPEPVNKFETLAQA